MVETSNTDPAQTHTPQAGTLKDDAPMEIHKPRAAKTWKANAMPVAIPSNIRFSQLSCWLITTMSWQEIRSGFSKTRQFPR